jgi:hypothetical protein
MQVHILFVNPQSGAFPGAGQPQLYKHGRPEERPFLSPYRGRGDSV